MIDEYLCQNYICKPDYFPHLLPAHHDFLVILLLYYIEYYTSRLVHSSCYSSIIRLIAWPAYVDVLQIQGSTRWQGVVVLVVVCSKTLWRDEFFFDGVSLNPNPPAIFPPFYPNPWTLSSMVKHKPNHFHFICGTLWRGEEEELEE